MKTNRFNHFFELAYLPAVFSVVLAAHHVHQRTAGSEIDFSRVTSKNLLVEGVYNIKKSTISCSHSLGIAMGGCDSVKLQEILPDFTESDYTARNELPGFSGYLQP